MLRVQLCWIAYAVFKPNNSLKGKHLYNQSCHYRTLKILLVKMLAQCNVAVTLPFQLPYQLHTTPSRECMSAAAVPLQSTRLLLKPWHTYCKSISEERNRIQKYSKAQYKHCSTFGWQKMSWDKMTQNSQIFSFIRCRDMVG